MSWESNHITGQGDFPPALLNKFTGRAVVMASGRSVWEDLMRFNLRGYGIIAVNYTIAFFRGKIDHAVSLHPEELQWWKGLRIANHFGHELPIFHSQYTSTPKPWIDYTWNIELGMTGTSGLFATMISLAMGYDRVVLAGVPMDENGHFYDPPDFREGGFKSDFIRTEWRKANELYFKGRVRSLSGWTRDLLGEPEDQWLQK